MVNRKWFEEQTEMSHVKSRIWGRCGEDACSEIESELGVQLGDEISDFIGTVGNASVGPFMLTIAGSDDRSMSAITETKTCRADVGTMPVQFVKIMDHAGESYFYNAESGTVEAYDSLNVNPSMCTLRFDGFEAFLKWLFKEAKSQSEDTAFAF
jgi:hypothetical protein